MVKIIVADTVLKRIRGLIGKPELPRDAGVFFPHTTRVHTFFMKKPIDVVYLNRAHEILARETLYPWKIGARITGTKSVLELRAGEGDRQRLTVGQKMTECSIEIDNQ